jgi:acetylglutamate kinase
MKAVIKIGGTLLETAADRLRIAEQVARQVRAGHRVLVVHGGGKQLTRFLDQMGITSRFVDGFRVTTEETLDGVVKVFAGTVNHDLLAAFVRIGLPAVGLSGIDAGGLLAEKLRGEQGQDWGYVGRIRQANPRVWDVLSQAGFLPVLACLAVGEDGQIYNVNADQAAVACAVHWRADRLIFLTDVDGVQDRSGQRLARLGADEIPGLLASGAVTGGMLAKLNAVQEAFQSQVPCVYIGNGHREDVLEGILAGEEAGQAGQAGQGRTAGGTILAPSFVAADAAAGAASGNKSR